MIKKRIDLAIVLMMFLAMLDGGPYWANHYLTCMPVTNNLVLEI